MRLKILVFIMILALLISIGGTAFLLNVFLSLDDKSVETAVINDETLQAPTIESSPMEDTVDRNVESTVQQGTSDQDKNVEEQNPVNNQLRIIAAGDILMGRSVKKIVETKEKRYLYPFEEVADMLKYGDIVFGNLEESITPSTKGLAGIKEGGKYVLKNEPEAINGLNYSGFNLLSLANNHILDYYEQGLLDTMDILDKNNIVYAGAGRNLDEARKLAVIEKKGLKVGMLAYTEMAEILYKGNPPLRFAAKKDKSGVAPAKEEYILEDVLRARNSVDILIVSLHWGVEYSYEPTPAQIVFAHKLMDSGVDILLGHHTHRCQGVEIYKGKPIFYSMGNFLFDQNNPLNQEGFFFDMQFTDKRLTSLSGIPFKIIEKSRIVPQTGQNASELLKREADLSFKLGSKCRIENDRVVFEIQ